MAADIDGWYREGNRTATIGRTLSDRGAVKAEKANMDRCHHLRVTCQDLEPRRRNTGI
ncbi:hypothetical protein VDGL01_12433 [Verticillium dahliae]